VLVVCTVVTDVPVASDVVFASFPPHAVRISPPASANRRSQTMTFVAATEGLRAS
jgi:hypothetical protein